MSSGKVKESDSGFLVTFLLPAILVSVNTVKNGETLKTIVLMGELPGEVCPISCSQTVSGTLQVLRLVVVGVFITALSAFPLLLYVDHGL